MISTIFGPMDEGDLIQNITVIDDNEDAITERFEYRLRGDTWHNNRLIDEGTLVHKYDQVRAKRVNTIFGHKMDVTAFDKHIDVIDNENEFTQCPEYRLREPYEHEGVVHPIGTLVHRSVHVQLKKGPPCAVTDVASF